MSLYDKITSQLAASLSGDTPMSDLAKSLGNTGSSASKAIAGAIGGNTGKALGGIGGSAVSRMVNKHIPPDAMNALNTYGGAIDKAASGDFDDLGASLIRGGALNKFADSLSGSVAMGKLNAFDNPVFSGVTLNRAIDLFNQHRFTKLAKKNLFLIEVSSKLTAHESAVLHLLATSVDYPSVQTNSTSEKLGTAYVDLIDSSEAIDLSVTAYDDMRGTLKAWFKNHAAESAPTDGTAGLPSNYAIRIRVVHGVIDDGQAGYEDKGWFRAQAMTNSLSRHEHDLHEVSMTFKQIDTFFGW